MGDLLPWPERAATTEAADAAWGAQSRHGGMVVGRVIGVQVGMEVLRAPEHLRKKCLVFAGKHQKFRVVGLDLLPA